MDSNTPARPPLPDEPGTGQTPLRILLVEDDVFDRLAVRRCLQQSSVFAKVDEAASAAEALERIGASTYDCLLLDYYLPDMQGLVLFQAIRAAVPDMPVVIFTGRGDEELAVELMKAGAVDYLPKASLTSERLAASLRYAMEITREAAARRRAEDELRTQEALFRTLANSIPQMTWIANGRGRRVWYNERWYEFTGMTFVELRDFGWQRAHHPDHLERVRTGQLAAFERGVMWEDTFPLRRKDGTYRWFLARAVPIRDADGNITHWVGTHTDLTERIEAEQALRASEEKYRGLFNAIDEGFCIIEKVDGDAGQPVEFRYLEANPAFEAQTGVGDPVGKTIGQVFAGEPQEWRDTYDAVLRTGEPRRFERTIVSRGRLLELYAFRVEDETQRRVAVLFADITARKEAEAERERLLADLQRSNDELQQFAHIVSHDLNEPLRTIGGLMERLARRTKGTLEAAAEEDMAFITDAARRMQQLLTDLLAYTRAGETPELRAVDCEAVLTQVVDDLRKSITESRAAVTHDPLPTVSGDPARLKLVFQNLIGNALKFRGAAPPCVHVSAQRAERFWRIAVRDNGIGIDPRHAERIFQVFQRLHTRGEYPGTGIGLAICKRIVENTGGCIWVESQPGQGTTFVFTLPAADE